MTEGEQERAREREREREREFYVRVRVRVASTTIEGLHCRKRRRRDACTRCSSLLLLHSESSSLASGSSSLAFSEEGTPWNGARRGRSLRSLLALAHVVERVVTCRSGVEEEERVYSRLSKRIEGARR